MSKPYHVGDMIFIQQKQSNGEVSIFKSRISDLTEDIILIEIPLNQSTNKYGFFMEGSEIDVYIDADDGSRYQFSCQVLGRKKEGEMVFTLLTHPQLNTITRTQRREFIRVPCYEEMAIHPVNNHLFHPFLAKVTDVSGGGLAFSLLNKAPSVKEGSIIKWYLSLPLQNGKIIHPSGIGKVMRIIEPKEKGLPYKYSVQFLEVAENERQKIMRFCFERQLNIHKKGVEL